MRREIDAWLEIYFNFIGEYIPPTMAEKEPTPEELEKMRTKEARKDKLHQNYLKRQDSAFDALEAAGLSVEQKDIFNQRRCLFLLRRGRANFNGIVCIFVVR